MENFIMLPNKLVWNHRDTEDTYLVEYGDKILHILSYLATHETMFEDCFFSIENMITDCGLTPKTGAGKVNNLFRDILFDLQSKRIIVADTDISKASTSSFISCKFNMPLKQDSKGKNTQFFPIKYDNYSTIMNYKGDLNKMLLLKTYYYISARLYRREHSNIEEFIGGKAETFYDRYDYICEDLKIAVETWNLYIKELQSLDLVYFDNIGLVVTDGVSRIANNVYCLEKSELVLALKLSKLFYNTNGYIVKGTKISAEARTIRGLKGKIKQLENAGQDTEKLGHKLLKLENQTENIAS